MFDSVWHNVYKWKTDKPCAKVVYYNEFLGGGGSTALSNYEPDRRRDYPSQVKKKKKKKRIRVRVQPRFFFVLALALIVLVLFIVALKLISGDKLPEEQTADAVTSDKPGLFANIFKSPTPSPTPTPEPTPTPTPKPPVDAPHAVEGSFPAKYEYETALEVNFVPVDNYVRPDPINFAYNDTEYAQLDGVLTFRGNNLRSSATFGTAAVNSRQLDMVWVKDIGEMLRGDIDGPTESTWSGSGWVGQPLIVKWPDSTRQIMNMYDWAKQKSGLVEVILACLDGKVYFMDLETGEWTREALSLNRPFKGAGSLDPRGYPILYLGSGDMYASPEQYARASIISLIDFSVLYEFGHQGDAFSLRTWHAYDSAPLVDASSDTLIYPGENGILYTLKLNTNYDEAAGTLSMNVSEIVKLRYKAGRSTFPNSGNNKFWLGYESSPAIMGHYCYVVTNDGFLQCIDLNTMEILWVQSTWDDTNGSPVVEIDHANRKAYVYVGTSLHFTKEDDNTGTTPFFKVDAITGEVIWQYNVRVFTKSGVSGGVQATALIGEGTISDLVIVPFARWGEVDAGVVVALEKSTGKVRWSFQMSKYTWSSPVAVYTPDGTAYIIICEGSDTGGRIYLLDGATGTQLYTFNAEKNIEASPAVYGNMIVIGTRGKKIWGLRIS